jgi:DNA-binding transcriptional MocR family regulator
MSLPALSPNDMNDVPLYDQVASRVGSLIRQGTFGAGDRLPSVRHLSREWKISITTVMAAYRQLENSGLIEARPQSGYYVIARGPSVVAPRREPPSDPQPVTLNNVMRRILRDARDPNLIPLGPAVPDPDLLPLENLRRRMSAIARRNPARAMRYEDPVGLRELRAEIARRLITVGCAVTPDEIIVTNGCNEALMLTLQSLTKPGDLVAVESPMYYGFLASLETIGVRTIEIPTSPLDGMCLDALEVALSTHPIRAVIGILNYNNPVGSRMSEMRKQRLVEMCAARGVALVEDNLYGDITFENRVPEVAKAYDRDGNVILCGSFSKTLAPGLRVGWCVPGKLLDEIQSRKMATNISCATLPQMVLAEFLAEGGYDHHLRRIAREYRQRTDWLRALVLDAFPQGTRVTRPLGGFVLWVELPKGFDTYQIYEQATQCGFSLAPGCAFSSSNKFGHCFRLNAAAALPRVEPMVRKLAGMIRQVANSH